MWAECLDDTMNLLLALSGVINGTVVMQEKILMGSIWG